jgi:hypothetical protein
MCFVIIENCEDPHVVVYWLTSIYLWLYSCLLDLGRLFSVLIPYIVGRTPWTGDQPFARPLPAHRTTQIQNKRTQTSMLQVGFEPTIPVFEPTKTLHRAATVIGNDEHTNYIFGRFLFECFTIQYWHIEIFYTIKTVPLENRKNENEHFSLETKLETNAIIFFIW